MSARCATKSWIQSLLWWPRHWRLSSRRLPEPFPRRELHRPSAVSDRSRWLEASSPVRSFPCPHSPSSLAEGSPRSIQGQNEQFLKTRDPFSGHSVPSDPIQDHKDPAITNSTPDAAWTVSRTPSMLDPGRMATPRFWHRLIGFRHVISGSLALASLNLACRNPVPTFPQRSPPSLLTTVACGGLRSTPDCRPRRAFLHLSYSCATPFGPAILVTQGH
jgi:hypothetical protein